MVCVTGVCSLYPFIPEINFVAHCLKSDKVEIARLEIQTSSILLIASTHHNTYPVDGLYIEAIWGDLVNIQFWGILKVIKMKL